MQNIDKNRIDGSAASLSPSNNLWSKYVAYWPLFVALIVSALVLAWLFMKVKAPLYEIKAAILIKDPKKGTEDTKSLESLNPLNSNKIIENELEILQSRTLMNEVVNKLGLYAPVSKKTGLRSFSAYTASPVKVEAQNPDMLSDTDKVAFNYNGGDKSITLDGKKYRLNSWISSKMGVFRFVANPNFSDTIKGGDFLLGLIKPKEITDDILTRLKVESASKQATILDLTYQDESPERGEDILNELLLSYNNSIINNRNSLASNTLGFVDTRLDKVGKELDSIERKDQQYKASRSAISIPEQGSLYLKNVGDNDQKLSEINMQLAVLDQVESSVLTGDGKSGIVPSTLGITDAVLTELLSKLYDAELQAESLKQTTAKNNPILVAVTNQIDKIKPQIVEIIKNQKRNLLASRNNLQSTNATYASTLQSLPEKERQLVEINRSTIVKNYIYSFLLQKREETALSFSSSAVENTVVDRGQASIKPVSPKGTIIYSAAIFGALILGIGSITAKETFNSKILFRHEIEGLTSYPIIAEIGYNKLKKYIVVDKGQPNYLTEQFRKLRTSFILQDKNTPMKKILVTSSVENEGKSFVALNLALSFASAGKKVVLIDFDLNKSTISFKLDLGNEVGLTSYLSGKSEAEDIIKVTSQSENLYVIPSGELLLNSSELLLSDRVEKLLSHLSLMFDYIIIDSAPVNAATDAYILSSYSDATLFIVRHGFTEKTLIEQLNAGESVSPLKNLSIIFNDVRPRGFGKNGYGPGYGYGYITNQERSAKELKQSKDQYRLEFSSNNGKS